MIEAMACGTPVIAWNRGSVPEIIENGLTGYIVESEEQAVAAIARVHTLDRQRVRATFEHHFTATSMARRYLSVYAKLLGPALAVAS
jgi:glycosyltransferase involved in cell wall biosynthesis